MYFLLVYCMLAYCVLVYYRLLTSYLCHLPPAAFLLLATLRLRTLAILGTAWLQISCVLNHYVA